MKAKEKAKDLVEKFENELLFTNDYLSDESYLRLIKRCALKTVDEILSLCWGGNEVGMKHWQQVKEEIEKL